MTTLQTRQNDTPEPVSAEEQAQAIANRDAIAKKFGHMTGGVRLTVSPDCVGHAVPLAKRVNR